MQSIEIVLSKGLTAIIDAEDFARVSLYKWSASAQGSASKPYAIRRVTDPETKKRVKVWLHRFITSCPEGMVVDHINGNGLDNRKINLRVVTFEENFVLSQERRRLNRLTEEICL